MQKNLKTRLREIDQSFNKWTSAKWAQRLSITGSVLWNLGLLLVVILVAGGVFGMSVGAGYFASLVNDEELRTKDAMLSEIYSYEETSELFFADGVYLGKLRTDLDREETKLENVSENAINAVFATEDEYFLEHEGIVPKAVLRGLLQDVSNSSTQTGGSTLTQQLIKNQILTNEVSYERKAKELLLAMRLEHFMEKEDILEAYLNIIPYGRNSSGSNIAGIETAANGIFNVSASELTLPQAAFIAGIPQAPFRYTPFTNDGSLKDAEGLEPGISRMHTVLYRMKETEYITEAEYEEAVAYDITQDFRGKVPRAYEEFPFVTAELERRATRIVMDVLAEQNGIDPVTLEENDKLFEEYAILADRAVRSNGYRIHSSIDKDLYLAQDAAKSSFDNYGRTAIDRVLNEDGEEVDKEFPVQVGSMTIENKTGRILSFIGGRDYAIENMNHATQGFRSIGSTIKPLLVYGPAIEFGRIGAGSPVVDVKFELPVGGTIYSPVNYINSSEQGIMPARKALAESQNLPAVRLLADIRNQMPIQFMKKTGFSRIEEAYNDYPSSALGGGAEASVEELTHAYAMIANGGTSIESTMIDRIEDAEGKVVYENPQTKTEVFSPQTAYILTDMLRDVYNTPRGTANRAKNLLAFGGDFAGKTGTTQDSTDVWIVGYNPNITMGVWLGYDREKFKMSIASNQYGHPSTRVNQLWARLMNTTQQHDPELVNAGSRFQAPDGVVTRSFCGISGLAPGGACTGAGLVMSDLFNANAMVPTKADDSLTSGSYVTVNGARYAALDSTPSEFIVSGGAGVSSAFVERMLSPYGGDPSKLFPANSSFSRVVSSAALSHDGVAPAGVQASLNGRTLTWSNSASNDVVGYRVYRTGGGNSLVASISEARSNSFRIPSAGSYFVVAVDITGQQSPLSNTVTSASSEPASPPPAESGGSGGSGGSDGDSNDEPVEDEPEGDTPAPDEPDEPEEGDGDTPPEEDEE
ncbi:transglycosylase domain-containing protein [Planomicrobium sp. YIM 101495]|uniref:transglycosylase domain-containing protein n=1 Tax=Planomicrobium sp. YIM 101495 TaxID=2665160 RepID=UPI0013FB8D6F|nr:peptidoglycan glycosyltransferase [Planomicrobium sp. YIM 101495]